MGKKKPQHYEWHTQKVPLICTSRHLQNEHSGETSHRYTSPPLRVDTACSAMWLTLRIRNFFFPLTVLELLEL